jgi:hypothetical protein
MNKKKAALTILIVGLVASNLWFGHAAFDCGISLSYRNDSLDHTSQALKQARAIIPLLANASSQEAIIEAAQSALGSSALPFEKDGYIWVGELGLKFNQAGQLVSLAPE